MNTCLASNNSCSSGEGPGVKVGSSISETLWDLTQFRQPIQVQIHLEMPGILVQLGHIQRT